MKWFILQVKSYFLNFLFLFFFFSLVDGGGSAKSVCNIVLECRVIQEFKGCASITVTNTVTDRAAAN